jgi:hypothetical protein
MGERSLVPMEILDTMQLQGGTKMFIAWYSWLTVLVGTLPIFSSRPRICDITSA